MSKSVAWALPGLVLTLSLGLTACSSSFPGLPSAHASEVGPEAGEIRTGQRIVFFGSSTTTGVGASSPEWRWTTLLSRYLQCQEVNEGLSGSSLSETPGLAIRTGLSRWKDDIVRHRPDHVVIMYGANDMDRSLPVEGRGHFRDSMRALLSGLAQDMAPAQILVLTPQRSRVSPERRRPYDEAMREAAREFRVHFIDVTAEGGSGLDLNAPDGLHLNDRGHSMLASSLLNALSEHQLVRSLPLARGGDTGIASPSILLPGGFLRVDTAHPLTEGIVRSITVNGAVPGDAVLGVFRPQDAGGLHLIYRTHRLSMTAGKSTYRVPSWFVLGGDRLFVWTAGGCLSSPSATDSAPQQLAFGMPTWGNVADLKTDAATGDFATLPVSVN